MHPLADYFWWSPIALSVTDANANVVAANAAFETLFGRSADGLNMSEVTPSSEWGWSVEVRRRLFDGDIDNFRATKSYVLADGSEQRLDVVVAPVAGPGGGRDALITAYDFAPRRSVVDDDAYLQRVLAASQATLLTLDVDGYVVSTSGRYHDALGYSADYWNNRPFVELVIDDDRRRFSEFFASVVDQPGSPLDIEIGVVAADGQPRTLLVSATNLLEAPEVTAIVMSLQDVSELHGRISHLVEERTTAESVAASRAELLATVSHELRNPLHALQGLAEILATSDLPGDLGEIANELYLQMSGLATVTADLLESARADGSGRVLQPSPTAVADLLDRGVQFGRAAVGSKPIEVVGYLETKTPAAVMVDRARVDQLVRNLVGNAAKFTDQGTISVTIGPIPHGLSVTVSDTGIGIPQSELARIMEPFHRGSNSAAASGAGLGLAVVKELVEAMHGEVVIDSQVGRGSVFRVEIQAPTSMSTPTRTGVIDDLAPLGLAVMVVDDDLTNRLIAVRQLQRIGCSVIEASSGTEAITLLRRPSDEVAVDAVLMDRRMPGMDGIETTREVRDIEHRSGLYIIGLSASASRAEQDECLDASMNDFLTKPASLVDLHAVLRPLAKLDDRAEVVAVQPPGVDEVESDSAPASEPAFDEARLAALVEEFGDPDLVEELLATFVGDLSGQLAEVRSSAGADPDVVKRVAHTVKGTAAMLGAAQLRTVAASLEADPSGPVEPFAAAIAAVTEQHDAANRALRTISKIDAES